IVRGDGGAEMLNGRFVVRRPEGELYQRLLARQRFERGARADAFRQGRIELHAGSRGLGLGRWRPATRETCKRRASTRRSDESSTVDHVCSSLKDFLLWLRFIEKVS